MAFPWQKGIGSAEVEAVNEFLSRGGQVLFAYHGAVSVPQVWEETLMTRLGIDWRAATQETGLWPSAWYEQRMKERSFEPTPELSLGEKVSLGAQRWIPELPGGGRALVLGEDGKPVIFDFGFRRGRVTVVPADVFSNGRLTHSGNLALWVSLADSSGSAPWIFDEYHHGLLDPRATDGERRFAWDLFVAHVVVMYLVGVAALAIRFGPAWSLRPLVTGSTASFLHNIGGLHDRLGHHEQAARRLVERWAAYGFREPSAKDLATAEQVGNGRQLVALAGELARRRRLPRHP